MGQGGDAPLDREDTGLMEEAKPDSGQDVEGVTEAEQGLPTGDLPPELVAAHEDGGGEDGQQEPRLLVLRQGFLKEHKGCGP